MEKILFYIKKLQSTFWFLPTFIILLGIILAIILPQIENHFTQYVNDFSKKLLIQNYDSAKLILSTISGAMIGVAGTVFSATLVVLTLASSQFGPRLIKNFMHVRINQIVLGNYVALYIYCLIILYTIRDTNDFNIPSFSILLAMISTIVNIILLIFFIHNIAVSIQADNIIANILNTLTINVKESLSIKNEGGEEEEEFKNQDINEKKEKEKYKKSINISCHQNGYIQFIDYNQILTIASNHDILVELEFRSGDYVIANQNCGKIYTNDTLDEAIPQEIIEQIIIQTSRSREQDLEFYINQVVEIAVRALSPGINDPYTAIACIDNLTSMMCYMTKVKLPKKYRYNDKNELKIIADMLDYKGILDEAFNQIRQFSNGMPSIIIRLMESLITIDNFATNQAYKKAIQKHAEMVWNVGEKSIISEHDLNDLKERAKQIISI
ncbi:MAG: DUF2254 domain-containing protein [Flavobacteriales bacterium]|nr:DUF2254 domain-containing protein [Flavobacteriales bacterium]